MIFKIIYKMKRIAYVMLSSLLMVVMAGCGAHEENSHEHHAGEHGEEAEKEGVEHHDGEVEIEDEQAEALGIKVEVVDAVDFAAHVKASGEVVYNPSNQGVISAPMAGRISYDRGVSAGVKVDRGARIGVISTAGMAGGDQLQAARIDYEAAKKEVERLEPLRREGIVTVGEYNQAVANLERAKNNLRGGAGSVVTSPISGVISNLAVGEGGYVNAGDVVGMIIGEGGMTLRVDVPVGDSHNLASAETVKVKFAHLAEVVEAKAMPGKGKASTAPGYVSMYYQLPEMEYVVAGSFAEVYLPTNTVERVVAVPRSAITEMMGRKMVYVKEKDSDHYRRVAVTQGGTDGEMVVVTGLQEGEMVVTEGVTFVRLAENAGAVPQGHSHNH